MLPRLHGIEQCHAGGISDRSIVTLLKSASRSQFWRTAAFAGSWSSGHKPVKMSSLLDVVGLADSRKMAQPELLADQCLDADFQRVDAERQCRRMITLNHEMLSFRVPFFPGDFEIRERGFDRSPVGGGRWLAELIGSIPAASGANPSPSRRPAPSAAGSPRRTARPAAAGRSAGPTLVSPHGMLMPGMPARLAVIV